ncbi:cadherin-22 isoform X1 [Peromyscus californicus insignis]|uniref:cadherin-22 isoform X1 n=1 Tax=Peromyscus californicus insignis TaxID=564181 RepID=UPI0022A697A8|nr:cadherin-22 isoform X1 [Peromyscus californicus insignis]XP_052579031.1 cadherin-22 isoform X1 [Peromyscus californicus insignis]XP_052579033.1 cadherin-22 isoform X1 [Peromyscus californicus insignis]
MPRCGRAPSQSSPASPRLRSPCDAAALRCLPSMLRGLARAAKNEATARRGAPGRGCAISCAAAAAAAAAPGAPVGRKHPWPILLVTGDSAGQPAGRRPSEAWLGVEPILRGRGVHRDRTPIHSDSDEGDGTIKYTISGEGAGTIFLIDELTGDIHATERLDREQKTFYTLRAQARDRATNRLLEPESEFIIKVQDINDSEPRFLHGPYIGSVAELSPTGTSVMQVMASDADDPTYGSSARLVYSVLDGEHHFTVDPKTGVIRTAVPDLDRESQERYEVVIQATDMAGQLGGLSGSTTVTIVVTDVNDNPPRFPQKMYQFSIQESAPIGTAVGRVKAEDSDVGENTDMTYHLREESGSGGDAFKVTTDSDTQEAIIVVQKRLDFESQQVHTVVLEALNKFVDPRFADLGTFRDQAIVRVAVTDVDEPPEFRPPSGLLEVQEDAQVGSLVGVVTARDPDAANRPVRYAIDRDSDLEQIFNIDADTGAIVTGKGLDRETAGWHNITVLAMEADNHAQLSRASLRIRILDVNDNPPELATPYEAAVCEDAKPGQLIQTISVVDRDEPQGGHRFYFRLVPEAPSNPHFSLLDIQDNTAAVHTQHVGFNRQEQDVFLLPILVVDSGPPTLSSTGTLTIRICGCDSSGTIQSCNTTAFVVAASLSPGALIALLVCVLILVVLALLILTLRRHHKSHLSSDVDEDMRDNVIKYNDEGGGEQDTEAYDMSALRSLYDFGELKGGDAGGGAASPPQAASSSERHSLPRGPSSPEPDFSVFRDFISRKVALADADLSVPPYDAFQTYAFEGAGSPAASLSSLHSGSTGSEQDFAFLRAWGPRFRPLAALYAGHRGDDEAPAS